MAPTTRERILHAAKELAEEHRSVTGVTISLESVSERSGLTKPGLMYHFASKEALMVGLVEQAAEEWDRRIRNAAGADPADLSPFDRHRGYVRTAMTAELSRADYWIFADALYQPSLARPWQERLASWFETDGVGPQARALLTAARFCADGAWAAEATGVFPAEDLAAVCERALGLVDAAESGHGEATA